jgi:hypothetical protein
MHNLHMTGPGVDQQTVIGAVQTVTWTVTFQNQERDRFVCDSHPRQGCVAASRPAVGRHLLRRHRLRPRLAWDRRSTRRSAQALGSPSAREEVRGSHGSGRDGT